MALKDRITEDMKDAMRAKETTRLSTIRLLLAAIKQKEVDERITVNDTDVVSIIDKMIKQRRESITQFETGKRIDLAAKERVEIDLLQTYLPQPASAQEIDALIAAAVSAVGDVGPSAMGKVMATLKGQLAGRADMGLISKAVKAKLTG